jgi:hypothetical protein
MKEIEANLPALGAYKVRFHCESKEVCDFLGSQELERLDHINHLGVASYVFTGVNHSRLEYVLLQCALIQLLPKFHKGKEGISLSGSVSIPGQESKISSCEELLKCWVLLNNSGHSKHTYGVERSLLNKACEDKGFTSILVEGFPADLKRFSLSVIDEYKDSSFHLVLSLYRIARLPKGSRLKARLFRIMRVLVLPMDDLKISKPNERYKIYRLKVLYDRIRLLSIVSLDSYYSHNPIRYDVSSALMNLDSLFSNEEGGQDFVRLLTETSSWLADEIYMHPKAASAQKMYEVASKVKIETVYKNHFNDTERFEKFFPNFMNNGFGKPDLNGLKHFARLSFPYTKIGALFGRSVYDLNQILEKQISPTDKDYVSLMVNPYSKTLHLDLLFSVERSTPGSLGFLCCNTIQWLLRLVEAQVKRRFRFYPSKMRTESLEEKMRERWEPRIIKDSLLSLSRIFYGVVSYLLPEGMRGVFTEYVDRRDGPLGFQLRLVSGGVYSDAEDKLNYIINENSDNLDEDRLHEISAIKSYVEKSKANVVIVGLEKFLIKGAEFIY